VLETTKLSSKRLNHLEFPPAMKRFPVVWLSLSHWVLSVFWGCTILTGIECYLIVLITFSSWHKLWSIFSKAYFTSVYLFSKVSIKVFVHF
jgi:hypothetical protein